jgi:hypothetical protein
MKKIFVTTICFTIICLLGGCASNHISANREDTNEANQTICSTTSLNKDDNVSLNYKAGDIAIAFNMALVDIEKTDKDISTSNAAIICSDITKDYNISNDFHESLIEIAKENSQSFDKVDWFTIIDDGQYSAFSVVADKNDHSKVNIYKVDNDVIEYDRIEYLSFTNEPSFTDLNYDEIYNACLKELENLSATVQPVEIDEQELYSDNNVKIVAKSLDSDFDGCKVKIYIENNSDLNLIIDPRAYSVNGIMVERNINEAYDEMAEISSGSKINAFLTLKNSFLQNMAIKQIKYIDVMFNVREKGSFLDSFNTGQLRIITTSSDSSRDDIDGEVLYDNGGINVKFLNNTGNTFKYIITNNTSNYFLCDIDEVNINGFSFSDLDIYLNDIYILNECQSVISLQPDEMFLKDNDISKIEQLDFKLKISPLEDYNSEYKTEKIIHNIR